MNISKGIFWNVDTQVDFVSPDGKLYVQDAERLKPVWQEITELASTREIKVVNTADWHYNDATELSDNPDYITTFPPHCMANTEGAQFIPETAPEDSVEIHWNKQYKLTELLGKVKQRRNVILRKNVFDVFAGNPYTSDVVNSLSPEWVVVYGVTTNVCVNDAVLGLIKKIKNIYVVEDAIKELPNIPLPFNEWKKRGVKLIRYEELRSELSN